MKNFPGDQGKTFLSPKKKLSKTSFIFEVLGDLDELESLIGLVTCYLKNKKYKRWLKEIEKTLFLIGGELAGNKKFNKKTFIEELDKKIIFCQKHLPPLKHFIIPGASFESSWIDLTRAITRRLERKIWRLKKQQAIDPLIGTYFNHLSKFFFFLARLINKQKKIQEIFFINKKPS